MRALSVLGVLVGLLIAATSAQASGFGCTASALRASVLGGPALEPTTANQGIGGCQDAQSTLTNPASALGVPLSASAVTAYTALTGEGPAQQALAAGGVADLRVASLPTLPLLLPQVQLPAGLDALSIDLGAVKSTVTSSPLLNPLQMLGLSAVLAAVPNTAPVDVRDALSSALPDGKLPNLDLLRIQGAVAYAGAACANGKALLSNSSQIGAITALGQTISPGQALDPTLIDTGYVDLSKVDLSKVVMPTTVQTLVSAVNALVPGVATAVTDAFNTAVMTALHGALDGVKVLDPTIAHIAVAPGGSTRTRNSVTQQALAITASIAGQKIIDAVIGEASASADDVGCSLPVTPGTTVAPTVQGATLQCSTRRLVLVDVLQRARRVVLNGVADPKLAGRTVNIVFNATGRTVAHAIVGRTGTFATTAPLPAPSLRYSNAARYSAALGAEKSLNLKLHRRLVLDPMKVSGGDVILTGRVVRPLVKPAAKIVLKRRISCKRDEIVGRFKPHSNGRFRIVVKAPQGPGAAVYRMTTFVLHPHGHRPFRTFTLPRAVELKG